MGLEIKRHRDKFEVNVFHGKGKQGASYHNIIENDPKKIALILHDLECEGFPIKKAVGIYSEMKQPRDWLGFS